jgi:hypothetical protein
MQPEGEYAYLEVFPVSNFWEVAEILRLFKMMCAGQPGINEVQEDFLGFCRIFGRPKECGML